MPTRICEQADQVMSKEWSKFVSHQTTECMTEEEQSSLSDDANIVDMRFVFTDRSDQEREAENLSWESLPPELKARLVANGFQDKDVISGKIKTRAGTFPNDVMNMQLMAQT
eukprot:11984943-Karenia_brevis.AAC.1